jgi:hypothetical protein
MAILEEAVRPSQSQGFDPDRLIRIAKSLGVRSSQSSVETIRQLRDSR